ncbi:CPBP family intramembrane glutamic endopeptidase [Paenibacillus sp. sgz500992]|uniref:CPBP family intramembrane glutamic endopeptidase n=1 Tax=Paenibacillus sp. sgz500992 TaxID=3242476 RepID=UPI0036D3548F
MNTHAIRNEQETEQHSLLKAAAFHLIPGAVTFLFIFFISPILHKAGLTIALSINLETILWLAPAMLGVLIYQARRQTGTFSLKGIMPYRQKLPLRHYLILVPVVLGWAVLIFWLMEPVSRVLLEHVFSYYPDWFDASTDDMSRYSHGMLVATWVSDFILIGLLAPVVEELYFRGYLLPRLGRYRGWGLLINVVLFVVYHFFSPWMIITRLIAIFPMYFVVWRTKNIYIGMVAHVLLNLISALSLYSLYFG